MTWLTRIAVKKRWVTFLIVGLLTVASVWATATLKLELLPDIEFPMTSIVTIYPQTSAEEVANHVSIPVEGAVSGIDRLRHLTSTSSDGMSMVFAQFEYGTDMAEVNGTIAQNLNSVNLPAAVRELPDKVPEIEANPLLYPIAIDMMPMVSLSISSDIPLNELREMADIEIAPILEAIDGVLNVSITGGEKDNVLVNPNPAEMNATGISTAQLAGFLTTTVATGEYSSTSDIESLALVPDTLTFGDIASVNLGPPPGTPISRTNGNPSMTIDILKDPAANTVEVGNAVIDEMEKLSDSIGNNLEFTIIFNQGEYIENNIDELAREAIVGAILAVIVVFLFLMAFRASLITAVSIPLSILLGFLAMRAWGITINILTLSAMTIAVGRVIDDSIVLLEVIYRHLQNGESFKDAAMNGAREVAAPITAATIATVVIFASLAFVGGIVGELFVPFALTVSFTMIASLLVALMVVPAMSKILIPKVNDGTEQKSESQRDAWYQRAYKSAIRWTLGHRAATVIIPVVIFAASLALIPMIGTSFIPPMGGKMIVVDIEMPPESDIDSTQEIVVQIEDILSRKPQTFLTYNSTIGGSGSFLMGFGSLMNSGDNSATSVTAMLHDDADLEAEADELRRTFADIAYEGTIINVTSSDTMMMSEMTSGLDISISGNNHEDIASVTQQLTTDIEDINGLTDIEVAFTSIEPKINIELDQGKVMASELPMQQLQGEFALMMMGGNVAQTNIGGKNYDILIQSVVANLNNLETASSLKVGYPETVPLGDIATVEFVTRPDSIRRIDRQLAASITGSITAQDVGSVNSTVQQKIDALDLPPGVQVSEGGVAEEMRDVFSDMIIAIIVAIALAFIVMVIAFRSVRDSLIIMVSLPMASIGAFLGLIVTGNTLSASGMMGLVMLVGIVLTNAIVLITVVGQLRQSGKSIQDALLEGSHTRLRPILMTAITTMIAMVPLAVGLGGGGILMAADLAIVIIGGLFSSTFLTLLVIPVIYSLVYDRSR